MAQTQRHCRVAALHSPAQSKCIVYRGKTVKDIIAGVVLIGIGFAFGGSVFLGDFSLTSILFDGLGTFWIVKGAIGLYKERSA
jgi:hypothetical protein